MKAKCGKCGGALEYYDGCLGYEAMVCQGCGEHYPIGIKPPDGVTVIVMDPRDPGGSVKAVHDTLANLMGEGS